MITDEQIIKALSCHRKGLKYCRECPLQEPTLNVIRCNANLLELATDLINSQQAEIEGLKAEIKKPVCMPGDTVYFPATDGEVYPATIRKIIYDTSWIAFEETAIGKQVFLTKEAAEMAGTDK